MQDIKTKHTWQSDSFWTKIGHVRVPGDPTAAPLSIGVTQVDGEKTVKTWQRVAVLRARPSKGVMIGYITDDGAHINYLNEIIETEEELFGMRVGNGDVTFFLLPRNPKMDTQLELVEVVEQNDARYPTLPLY